MYFLNFIFVVGLIVGNVNSVEKWTTFKVKFTKDKTGEWVIPLTLDEAKQDYVSAGYHEQFPQISILCTSDDPQACPMYDVYGRLCGFRVTYIIKDLDLKSQGKLSYQYDNITCFKKGQVLQKTAYYTDILFTSPERLRDGGVAVRAEPLGDSLWFKLDSKPWTEIPRQESRIVTMPGVVKQNCYPRMGQHYFFNFDKSTPCDSAFPFFTMYDGGQLVGVGLVTFGTFTSNKRVWFENIPETFVPMIFSSAPDCLAAGIRQFGGIGLHMYMTESPELIKCAC